MTLHHKVGGAWRTISQPKLKLTGAWRDASAMYTKVNGEWRQTWPANSGTPRIVGVAYMGATDYLPGIPGSDFRHTYPAGTPRYKIVGDKTLINSAKVEIKMTPAAPKTPAEHTFSWDVTWDWGIYKVSWRVDASTTKYYIAGMTHAEAAAIALPKYATLLWSPREGGWFAYMPVCWDASGVTVPMRSDADGGLDAHSGYAPFPPGRAASSTLANYTVADGYKDQEAANGYFGYSAANITTITILLRNTAGTVISQYGPVALPYGNGVHVPGLGTGPAALMRARSAPVEQLQYYWPTEYRTLFDHMDVFGQAYTVVWHGDGVRGDGEWWVYDRDGEKAGDFGLGFRHDASGLIEITSSNVRPELVGERIMFHMQEHLLTWCPTEYVIAPTPDPMTQAVMEGWGWRPMSELLAPLNFKISAERQFHLESHIYARSDPMYNRFTELGLPPWQEVFR